MSTPLGVQPTPRYRDDGLTLRSLKERSAEITPIAINIALLRSVEYKVEPLFDPLRDDPRFTAMPKRLNLPE